MVNVRKKEKETEREVIADTPECRSRNNELPVSSSYRFLDS